MTVTSRKLKDGTIVHDVIRWHPQQGKTVRIATGLSNKREAERIDRSPLPGRHDETVASFALDWLSKRSNVESTTREGYDYALSHAIAYFGDKPLKALTHRDCEDYASMLSENLKPLTARNAYGVFTRMLDAAKRFHLIYENPARGASNLPKRRRSRQVHPLTKEEHASLVDSLPLYWKPLIGAWPLIGFRRSEVRAFRVSDVTETHALVRQQLVRGDLRPPKGGKLRDVPLVPQAASWLALQAEQRPPSRTDFLFVSEEGNALEIDWLWRTVMNPAFDELGIERRVPHDFRHSFAVWLLYAGLNMKQVADVMGHEQESTTSAHYSHLLPDSHTDVRSKLTKYLM